MRRIIIIAALCFAAILIGAIYTLVEGIICGSYLGISLSLGCMAILYIGLQYFKKMMMEAEKGV